MSPSADPGELWFERLVAATELALRKMTFQYYPQGPLEKYRMPNRIAKSIRNWTCPYCAAVLNVRPPILDGLLVSCPACYGCFDMEVS